MVNGSRVDLKLKKLFYRARVDSLNEEQYQAVCKACDRALLAPDSTVERVAIPWLHVVREHPVFLDSYGDLFKPTKGFKTITRRLLRVLRSRAGWLAQLLKSLRSTGQVWFGPEDLPKMVDVLFISHLLNASHSGQQDDFYFGNVPNDLSAGGHSAVIALINHSGDCAACLWDKWKGKSVPRVILADSLRFMEEVNLYRRLSKESFRLRKLGETEGLGITSRVFYRASEEALSNGSRTTLQMALQIGELVSKLKPKAIVVTYEGHAWERIAFAAARNACPGVQCIGYQHAALFRLQHAIRRNLSREYNPDHILTAGNIAKAQLEHSIGLNGIPISVLGSNRALKRPRSVNHDSRQIGQEKMFLNPVCLVLPEGIVSECHLLFNFSLECARLCPDIQFIWRLHPIVKYKSLTINNQKLRELPRNIMLSQASLEEDISCCSWVLYRGTTAVIPAVIAGLRPIYVQQEEELAVDPLYELKGWRTVIKTVAEFRGVIRHDQASPRMDVESEFRLAEGYCYDFFTPLNSDVLKTAIN